jgi:hypothetical protein
MSAIAGRPEGYCGLTQPPVVVPAVVGTVELTGKGLCILPDLCKTPRTRFAQVLGKHSAFSTGCTGRRREDSEEDKPENSSQPEKDDETTAMIVAPLR